MRTRVARTAVGWLVLGATATLVGGCGGDAASASNPAPARETTSEQAEARAFARAVNLRAFDIPGFKVVLAGEAEHEASPGPFPRRVEQCDGGPVVNGASRGIASPLLQKEKVPIQTVLSGVYPMSDASMTSSYIAAADSHQGLNCIQSEEARTKVKAYFPPRREFFRAPPKWAKIILAAPKRPATMSSIRSGR